MTRARWLLLICLVPIVAGLARLRFDTDVLNLLPDELPTVAGLKLYQRHFANNRELVITVTAMRAADTENAARSIAAALQASTNLVATAVWQPPWLDHPEQTAQFLAWLWLSQPTNQALALKARMEHPVETLADTRERLATSLSPLDLARLSHDPFGLTALGMASLTQGQDWFATPEGTFRMLFVQPKVVPASFKEWKYWLDQTRTIAEAAAHNSARIGFTGTPVFTVETAAGMESDMKQSIISTLLLVGALFWWAHRRYWPLLWMLTMLVSSLLITMALGGLIFGSLNVVSFGFAAILLGLGVDYSLVLYQELLGHPSASAAEIRKEAAPGIWWSAGTTALAFALLNFAGLPGLGQLGTLVAVGIMVAATAMLYGFLPLMTRRPPKAKSTGPQDHRPGRDRFAWPATVVIAVVGLVVLIRAFPQIDRSAEPLGTVNSEAAKTAREIDAHMNRGAETLWLVIEGRDAGEVRSRLKALGEELSHFNVELPTQIWPQPELQKQNLAVLRGLPPLLPDLRRAAEEAGFTDEAMVLTASMLDAWRTNAGALWPQDEASKWLVNRISAETGHSELALGLLHLEPNSPLPKITTPGVFIAGWSRLAEVLLQKVEHRLVVLTIVMITLLMICLRLALGKWMEVALSFAALAFGFVLTLLIMAAFHVKWNLLSLTAIPLLMGAAVDYTIHVQLALNRYDDDIRMMRRTIGRALLLLTAAAVAGFASLGLASNAGLASFEILCAIGMICIFLVSLYLLPVWHRTLVAKKSA